MQQAPGQEALETMAAVAADMQVQSDDDVVEMLDAAGEASPALERLLDADYFKNFDDDDFDETDMKTA